jgi:nucleoid-associated protein YgaU
MFTPRSIAFCALPALLALSGCGYVHVGRLPEPTNTTTIVGDEKLLKENSDLQLEKKMLQQELALTRAQGDALRTALENRAADGDTSRRLVDKLNETTRELAILRANYAKLQTERTQTITTDAEANVLKTQLGEAEEKLAASLRMYTELQEEVTRLRTDVNRTRAENVALGEQVKTVTAQNEQAQATLAQLNSDLLAQKDARFRAEQDAATLRTELKNVAPNASVLAQQRTGAAAEARTLVAEHAAETAALKQQLDALRTKVDTLTAERAKLQQQLGVADLANIEASLTDVLQSASSLRTENAQLKNQLAELKSGAAGAAGSDTLRDQLRDAQAQAAALTDENARLKARLGPAPSPAVPTAPLVAKSSVNATLVTTVTPTQRINLTPSEPVPKTETAPGTRFHVVAGGDTLAKISSQYYGTPGRWGDILEANRDILGEGNNLVVGRTLRIP